MIFGKRELETTGPTGEAYRAFVCDGPSGGEDLLLLVRTVAWWGHGQDLYQLLGAATTCHKLNGLNKRNELFCSSGG